MRRILLVLALTGCTSNPATYGPPRGFEPNAAAVAPAAASNVVALDAAGSSIEASIASVPGNPSRVAANVMKQREGLRSQLEAYHSADGGATWTKSGEIPFTANNGREYDGQGDAVIAADRAGRFYSALLVTKGGNRLQYSGVAVSRSDDGGATWETPVVVTEVTWPAGGGAPFDDKEWIAVDNSGGPRDGTVYVVWQRMAQLVVGANSTFYISRSTDQGRTWSEPKSTSNVEPGGAMMIDVGPEGEIYIGRWSSSRGAYISQVSTDGGETFSNPVTISNGGWQPQAPPTRYFAYPRLHVDRTFGTHRGNVYFVGTGRGIAPDGRTVATAAVSGSTDGGKTWSPLRSVAAVGNGDALFPMGIVNETNGDLVVAWLDRRDDPEGKSARLYATRSRDGGVTFEPAQAFTPPFSTDAQWLGEYNAIAAAGNHYVATYSDAAGRLHAVTLQFDRSGPRRRSVRQ
jgi:hypothetical protein